MNARLLWSWTYDREPFEWYVEPFGAAAALFRRVPFEGHIVDPACGRGAVVMAARACGYDAWGSDLVQRAYGPWDGADEIVDFFGDDRPCDNIASNPPYDVAAAFLDHALTVARDRVALLLPLRWIASITRLEGVTNAGLEVVVVLTPRPSMPPGVLLRDGLITASGGKTDYAWFVWRRGWYGEPVVRFGKWRDPTLPKSPDAG